MITAALIALTVMSRQTICDGITYADNPSSLWIPVSSLRKGVSVEMEVEERRSRLLIGQSKISLRKLIGVADWAVKISDLRKAGFGLEWDDDEKKAGLWLGNDMIVVYLGSKLVQVGLDNQELRAYQGQLLVLRTSVSAKFTGRIPQGIFQCIAKERVHLSNLYNRVPMPFSVRLNENILLHAFPDIPPYPLSHGCIQLPLSAAQALFEWIELGTEIEIR